MSLNSLGQIAYLMSLLSNMVGGQWLSTCPPASHVLRIFLCMHFLSYRLLLFATLPVFLFTSLSFRAILKTFFISVWQLKMHVQYHKFETVQRYLSWIVTFLTLWLEVGTSCQKETSEINQMRCIQAMIVSLQWCKREPRVTISS